MRPRLVNDAGDRPGTTSTSFIWRCDRCRHREIDPEPPEGWVIDEAVELSICPDCAEEE